MLMFDATEGLVVIYCILVLQPSRVNPIENSFCFCANELNKELM